MTKVWTFLDPLFFTFFEGPLEMTSKCSGTGKKPVKKGSKMTYFGSKMTIK